MWQNSDVASPALVGVFAALFGLVIGSFLNVCILRIPEGKSIVMPASACPKCGAAIKPWDNIPVVSWLLLEGKCRACKTQISWMYPAVELLTGALFWGCYYAFGLTTEGLKWAIFSALMIVLVFTDMRERILPDVINFSGFAVGLLLSLFTKPADGIALWIANRIFDFPPRRRCFRWPMRCSARRSAVGCCGWSPKRISGSAGARAWASGTSR